MVIRVFCVRSLLPIACSLIAVLVSMPSLDAEEVLTISGSTTVNPVVTEAAEILQKEKGRVIHVDTQGGSSGGIMALGEGRVRIAMSSRKLKDADRVRYPEVAFTPIHIGEDAVAIVVSKDVWDGGVRSLSRGDMQRIYERKVRNWKALGGPDRRIVFFNKEPGRGTWEVFVKWLYGGVDKTPLVAHPEVGANEEARAKVASTRGAMSQLSSSWADGRRVYALAIRVENGQQGGEEILPTREEIAKHRYPLSRSLYLMTNGEAGGLAKELIDFILSPRGEGLVRKHGYLALSDLK